MTESDRPAWELAVDGIDYPDADAVQQLRQWQVARSDGLGRLDELAVWVAATTGRVPLQDFARVRVLLVAGDHGVAESGSSGRPAGWTAAELARIADGGGATVALAELAGATLRVVNAAVAGEIGGVDGSERIVAGNGRIDREDALTEGQARAALTLGVSLADREIDAGADLLVLGDLGIGSTTTAATLIAIQTDTEPSKVTGRSNGIDDATWIAKCAAIRDARRRGRPHRGEILDLVRVVGGADVAVLTGLILQAANRRTPVLIDGVVSAAAAILAQSGNARVIRWIRAAHRTAEPAHAIALDRLGLEPILDLDIATGGAVGALTAVPVLRAAIRTAPAATPTATPTDGVEG